MSSKILVNDNQSQGNNVYLTALCVTFHPVNLPPHEGEM